MTDQRNVKYNISKMTVEGNLLSWGNHVLRAGQIARIWTGSAPEEPFPAGTAFILLFIALTGQRFMNIITMLAVLSVCLAAWVWYHWRGGKTYWVNIGLNSGPIYSFGFQNDVFAEQLFHILTSLISDGHQASSFEISFEGDGEIINHTAAEKEKEVPDIMEVRGLGGKSGQLVTELQKLYQGYMKKSDADSKILSLIQETTHLIEANDKDGTKASFKKFVTLGLIHECNELRLDTLIQEIKNSIY